MSKARFRCDSKRKLCHHAHINDVNPLLLSLFPLHLLSSTSNTFHTQYFQSQVEPNHNMSTLNTTTTQAESDITSLRNRLIPTLAYPSAERRGTKWDTEMHSRPQTIDRGLTILKDLHKAYNNVSATSDVSEYGVGLTTFPMARLAEARIRAVMNTIHELSTTDQLTLFLFFDSIPPRADERSWVHDNRCQYAKDEFAVAPQAWMIRAGTERIGELLGKKHEYRDLYHALSHRDEVWRESEGNDGLEYNGLLWLGTMIEKWGWELDAYRS